MTVKEFLNKMQMPCDVKGVYVHSGKIVLTFLDCDDIMGKVYYGCGDLPIKTFKIDAYNSTIYLYVKEK